ncbi:MAG TPA: DUF3108 domain-containing protein [Thermoanaerobaculia bacterium]|nr:DUF3108 domain-containing protein [Thermoanaerobaculia bacterium]
MKFVLAAIIAAVVFPTIAAAQTFAEGETLDYNLTWLKVTGGTARMTIGPHGDEALRITSVARSSPTFSRFFKVRDEIETTVAKDDFSTLRYVKRLDEEGDKIEEVTVIEEGVATRTRRKVKKTRVPRPVFDPISVIYLLRTRDLSVGKVHDLDLIADGKLYSVHARVVRKEKVQTPAGTFNCVRVEPQMVSGGVEREERLYIWYTDDERKLPVRIRTEIKVGAITATLRGHAPGVSSPEPPVLAEPAK